MPGSSRSRMKSCVSFVVTTRDKWSHQNFSASSITSSSLASRSSTSTWMFSQMNTIWSSLSWTATSRTVSRRHTFLSTKAPLSSSHRNHNSVCQGSKAGPNVGVAHLVGIPGPNGLSRQMQFTRVSCSLWIQVLRTQDNAQRHLSSEECWVHQAWPYFQKRFSLFFMLSNSRIEMSAQSLGCKQGRDTRFHFPSSSPSPWISTDLCTSPSFQAQARPLRRLVRTLVAVAVAVGSGIPRFGLTNMML